MRLSSSSVLQSSAELIWRVQFNLQECEKVEAQTEQDQQHYTILVNSIIHLLVLV